MSPKSSSCSSDPITDSGLPAVAPGEPISGNKSRAHTGKRPPSTDSRPQAYRPDVDGLRAVAVLSVVGFHAYSRFVPGGFVGVDVFFVISGFLISSIIFKELEEGRFKFTTFYQRRVRRIFPALSVVLLATWIAGWFALMTGEYGQLGENIAAGAGFVSNVLLWRQSGYFDSAAELKPLLHLWSLGIEEQFYLLWPLAVYLTWKLRVKPLKFILPVLGISFVLNVGTVGLSPDTAFYLPHTRFWELMIGSSLAYIHLFKKDEFDDELIRTFRISRWKSRLPDLKASLGLLFIAAAVVLLNKGSVFPGVWALLPTVGAFLLISAGNTAWINRKFLSNRTMVLVGLISYPLYLWHWPMLSFARIVGGGEPSNLLKLAIVALAILLSWLTYQVVEKPIRHGRLSGMAVPALAAAMIAVVGLGALSIFTHGLPARYSSDLRQLTDFKENERTSGWREGRCFIGPPHDASTFDATCTDAEPAGAPLVYLWGDSHAADLYPGLRQMQASYTFRIAQYDSALCTPVLDFDNPRQKLCRKTNDWVWEKISKDRPEVVILAAQFWFTDLPDMRMRISETVMKLKQSGVKTVMLVGPNPEWKETLARSLFVNYYRGESFHKIPNKMLFNVDDSVIAFDRRLKEWVSGTGALYISPISLLCDQTGCLTRVEVNGVTDLTAFDQHHLTPVGSQYVTRAIIGPVLEDVLSPEARKTAKLPTAKKKSSRTS